MKNFITTNIKIYLSMQYRLNRSRFILAHVYLFAGCLLLAALALPFTLPSFVSSWFHMGGTIPNSATDVLTTVLPPDKGYSIGLGFILANYLNSFFSWSILFFAASICLSISRLYDLEKDYRLLLLYAVPFANIIFFLYLCLKKGSESINKYGIPVNKLSDSALLATPGYHLQEPINTSYPATLFEQIFSWEGRLNRLRYFLRNIGLISICILAIAILTVALIFFAGIGVIFQLAVDISDITVGISFITFLLLVANIFFFASIAVTLILLFWKIRRWHDLSHSGFYVLLTEAPYYLLTCVLPSFSDNIISTGDNILLLLITIITFVWMVCANLYLLLIKGTSGENKYGKDPIPVYEPEKQAF